MCQPITNRTLYIKNKQDAERAWQERDNYITNKITEAAKPEPDQAKIDHLQFMADVCRVYANTCELLASMYYNDPATWEEVSV